MNLYIRHMNCTIYHPCFFVQPDIFEKIAKEGVGEAKERALYDLRITQLIQGLRIAYSKYPMTSKGHIDKQRIVYDMRNSDDVSELPGKPVRYEGDPLT